LFLFAAFLSAAESAQNSLSKGSEGGGAPDYEAAFEFYKAAYQHKPDELKYRVPFERTRMLSAASKINGGKSSESRAIYRMRSLFSAGDRG